MISFSVYAIIVTYIRNIIAEYVKRKPIIIENNVWIGECSTALKGVHIGEGSIVASHCAVTKDVHEYCIVAGNTTKLVKYLNPRKVN